MPVEAVQHVRRMRGGAQSHLMRASDGDFYVVKFQNNPQHPRILANEMLATALAARAGLEVARGEIVEVQSWLIEHTPELRIQLAGQSLACKPGLQFGSRYVVDPLEGQLFDYLPEALLERVHNVAQFAGMLAFDKWTCNANGRQAIFWRKLRQHKYRASFIDQGYCFNVGEWNFPDSALRGVYARNHVYRQVTGWDSFEPWLSNIEAMGPSRLWACADTVPPEWYGSRSDMERLIQELIRRQARVRDLITAFRHSTRQPFPNWAGR